MGFKLCVGCRGSSWRSSSDARDWHPPDFIVVDGAEGGTGAAPTEFADHIGAPLREGLLFVHNTLVGAGVREGIKIGAAGRIISGFDIASALAIGADWTNSARGFMFAIGCVQSLACNTNHCPTGCRDARRRRQKAGWSRTRPSGSPTSTALRSGRWPRCLPRLAFASRSTDRRIIWCGVLVRRTPSLRRPCTPSSSGSFWMVDARILSTGTTGPSLRRTPLTCKFQQRGVSQAMAERATNQQT